MSTLHKFPPLLPVPVHIPPSDFSVSNLNSQILEYLSGRSSNMPELKDYIEKQSGRLTLHEMRRLQLLLDDISKQMTLSFYISNTALVIHKYENIRYTEFSPNWKEDITDCINEYLSAVVDYIDSHDYQMIRDKCLAAVGLNTPSTTFVHETSYGDDPVGYSVQYARQLAETNEENVDFVRNTVRHPHNLRSLGQFYYVVSESPTDQQLVAAPPVRRRGKHYQEKCAIQCKHCGNSDDFVSESNVYICSRCFRAVSEIEGDTTFVDIDRVHLTSRYKYDRVDHFKDELIRHQGKQNTRVPNQVVDKLIRIAESMNLINNNSDTREEKYRNFTKFTIYQIMQVNKLSKYYHDINKLHADITGIPAPNVHSVERKLMQMIIKVLEVYDKVKPPQWKNFMQGQYILCQLMIVCGVRVRADDILLLRTWEKIREHDAVFRVICRELDWPFVSLSSY